MERLLAELDATELARRVHRGEVDPVELVDAAVRRAERLEPRLGALAAGCFESARDAAKAGPPDGPFRGLPFLMKDVGATQAGQPQWAGNRALRDAAHRAACDTYLGARFRAAGLVTLGTSRTPEFGLQSTTQPLALGPTRNPFDPERSAGGSSGGACAAVAAGIVPLAHANDGAGSIRIPAAFCGVVGLKPSRGRVPLEPTSIARNLAGFAVTRSVRDTAALLDAVHGSEPGDLYRAPSPARPYVEEPGTDPGPLRVGLLTRPPGGATLHPDCERAAREAAHALAAEGLQVEEAGPAALFEEERALRRLGLGAVEYRLCLRALASLLGRPVGPDDVEPYLWTLADPEGATVAAEDWLEAAEWEQGWAARVASWWVMDGFDLLLTPTVPEPAPELSWLDGASVPPWTLLERMAPHMAFTEPFNVTGHPALSVPFGSTAQGLPLGVQLVARLGREDLLLRVGARLEALRPPPRPRLDPA